MHAQSVAKTYDIFMEAYTGNQLEYHAYTATAVQGLINKAGFLKGEDDEQVFLFD